MPKLHTSCTNKANSVKFVSFYKYKLIFQGWSWGLSRTDWGTCSRYHFWASGEIVANTPAVLGCLTSFPYFRSFPCISLREKTKFLFKLFRGTYLSRGHPLQPKLLQVHKCPIFLSRDWRKHKHEHLLQWLGELCFQRHLDFCLIPGRNFNHSCYWFIVLSQGPWRPRI